MKKSISLKEIVEIHRAVLDEVKPFRLEDFEAVAEYFGIEMSERHRCSSPQS